MTIAEREKITVDYIEKCDRRRQIPFAVLFAIGICEIGILLLWPLA